MPSSNPVLISGRSARRSAVAARWLALLMSLSCGVLVANVYYIQMLGSEMAAFFSLSKGATGLLIFLTQGGYALGLLAIVPLSDIVENRRLILCLIALAIAGAILTAGAQGQAMLLPGTLALGLGSVGVQVLVPYAVAMAPEGQKGRMVGTVTAGLMAGVMLARPAASALASLWGWRATFLVAALCMLALGLLIKIVLPARPAEGAAGGYTGALRALVAAPFKSPILRQRIGYQMALFATLSMFWAVVPMHLSQKVGFDLGQLSLFALVGGVAAVLAAPVAGRLADRGSGARATGWALAATLTSVLAILALPPGPLWQAGGLAVAAIVIDFSVTLSFVVGQRMILSAAETRRGAYNGAYMASFYISGAIGSGLGGWLYVAAGMWLPIVIALGVLALALLGWLAHQAQAGSWAGLQD